MTYTIGEMSKMFALSIPTLRYYDKEGLFLDLDRDASGNRLFDERHVEALRVIECLKKSGLQIKDIKKFMELVSLGQETVTDRKGMFLRQKKDIESKILELENALDMIKFKCWYYETAEKLGEKEVKAMIPDELPREIKNVYEKTHI